MTSISAPTSTTSPLDQLTAPRTPPRRTTTNNQQHSHTLSNDQPFPLDKDFAKKPSLSLSHPTKTAFTVAQCLTPTECAALIQLSENVGYSVALLNAGTRQILATETRKSQRAMVDDEVLSRALWERIKHLVPSKLEQHGQTYVAVGLNERLRFLKYNRGGYFVQHMDGVYIRPPQHPNYGERSMLTYLVYLNENFEGGALEMEWGEEVAVSPTQSSCFSKSSKSPSQAPTCHKVRKVTIQPTTGVVVVHDHQILHEAMMLESGTRYCIRTDIMFAPITMSEEQEEERKE